MRDFLSSESSRQQTSRQPGSQQQREESQHPARSPPYGDVPGLKGRTSDIARGLGDVHSVVADPLRPD
jgi:hypothetical protein